MAGIAADCSAHEVLLVCYGLPEISIASSRVNYFGTHFLNVGGACINLCGIHINGVSCCASRNDIITVKMQWFSDLNSCHIYCDIC